MAPPLLTLRNIALTFGGTPLFTQANLTVEEGERLCLVGRNGSGKSTLLKIAAGLIEADGGERIVRGGITIRYLSQEPVLTSFPDVLAYVQADMTSGDDPYRPQYLLQQLGLNGSEQPAHLSGGEARRAALARALAPQPDILLLDEPTNHLDLPAIEWLEEELGGMKSAIVVISHDRRFMEKLSRRTLWIDRGITRLLEQGFAAFEGWRDDVLEQEERDAHKLDRRIVAEEHWLRYGVTARRKRNQGRLRALTELRQKRRDARRADDVLKAQITQGDVSGKIVIEAEHLSKRYGDRVIVQDFSCRIQRGDRVGIIGPNGAGKTTLVNLLTGVLTPDTGNVKLGANLAVATLDQRRAALDPETSLRDTLTGGRGDAVRIGDTTRHVVSYMKDFLFKPEQAGTAVTALSGGERGRLMLARAFAIPSNLLVLDEPTNDLDLETLDLLQELLSSYSGTVLLVSHDRDFLDRVVTSVIAAEGQGRWQEYAGGYSDMTAQRRGGLATVPAGATKAKAARTERPSETAKPGRGLTFTQLHKLKSLPERIDKLNDEIATLQGKLSTPDLFAREPERFATLASALEKAQSDLHAAEEEWLALELLKEQSG